MNDELMQERFSLMRERISEIQKEELVKEPYRDFFRKTGDFILEICQIHDKIREGWLEKASMEEMIECQKALTSVRFEIPIKDKPQSNLNVFFGKGRETMSTGVIKPRHWYEAEIIVPKKITSMAGYPQAQSSTASFNVITDDGWKFKCKVSGDYSKNLRSEGDLRILGKWLKGRLENAGVLSGIQPVTNQTLQEYGRTSFSLIKTTIPNLWYLDFGVR